MKESDEAFEKWYRIENAECYLDRTDAKCAWRAALAYAKEPLPLHKKPLSFPCDCRELLSCGHPRACLVEHHRSSRDVGPGREAIYYECSWCASLRAERDKALMEAAKAMCLECNMEHEVIPRTDGLYFHPWDGGWLELCESSPIHCLRKEKHHA